jgi:hypothetical protein
LNNTDARFKGVGVNIDYNTGNNGLGQLTFEAPFFAASAAQLSNAPTTIKFRSGNNDKGAFTSTGLGVLNIVPSSALSVSGGGSFGAAYATIVAPTDGLITKGTTGVGTSSPFAKFSVHANAGDTATTLFAIGSSTATATSTLFSVSNTGSTTLFQLNSSLLKTNANGTKSIQSYSPRKGSRLCRRLQIHQETPRKASCPRCIKRSG